MVPRELIGRFPALRAELQGIFWLGFRSNGPVLTAWINDKLHLAIQTEDFFHSHALPCLMTEGFFTNWEEHSFAFAEALPTSLVLDSQLNGLVSKLVFSLRSNLCQNSKLFFLSNETTVFTSETGVCRRFIPDLPSGQMNTFSS